MTPIRIGIVGAGPMGRLHARTVSSAARRGDSGARLVGITDHHPAQAEAVAREVGVEAFDNPGELFERVDVAIVAVPTSAHEEVAAPLLERGIDLLIEKPLAESVEQGERLVARARANARILQVGHVEWYHPGWREAARRAGAIRHIEVERMNPPGERGLDVDVVADLMLHDLDWVSRLVGGEIDEIRASGHRGRTGRLDAAEARLHFRSGCTASLKASRLHTGRSRLVRIEGSEGVATADLSSWDRVSEAGGPGRVDSDRPADPLDAQWRDFLVAVRRREAPVNDGEVGIAALRLVDRVRDAIGIDGVEKGAGRDDDPHLGR